MVEQPPHDPIKRSGLPTPGPQSEATRAEASGGGRAGGVPGGVSGGEPDVDALSGMRFVSMLPAQVLHPDEMIVLLLKPSLWFVVITGWRALAALGVMFAAVFLLDPMGEQTGFERSEWALVFMLFVSLRLLRQEPLGRRKRTTSGMAQAFGDSGGSMEG